MRTLPNPFRCALGGGSNDYLACRPICLLVAGCLCVSSLRTTFSGMRLFACWAPCGGGRRFSAVRWELGLALSAPGRSDCPTSSASGGLCAGVGGCALRACHIQSEWGLCFAGYGLDHFDWSVVGCLRFLRVGSAGEPADRYLLTSQHSVVSCMPRSLNGGLL